MEGVIVERKYGGQIMIMSKITNELFVEDNFFIVFFIYSILIIIQSNFVLKYQRHTQKSLNHFKDKDI